MCDYFVIKQAFARQSRKDYRPLKGKLSVLPALAFFCLAMAFSLSSQAKTQQGANPYLVDQQKADEYYNKGNFSEAFEKYLKLAKKGDLFSQYRISYMYFAGEGTEQNWAESYAWATLAAQTRIPQFVEYRDSIAANVPEKKQRSALRKADYYYRRWGNLALANDLQRQAKRELRECTGSRLGTRCEDVYAAQMPNNWGVNPGSGTGGAGAAREAEIGGSASRTGTNSSGVAGAGGGTGRDIDYYQNLRQSIANLDRYIRNNSGNVNIGELEVIEPEAEKTPNADVSN